MTRLRSTTVAKYTPDAMRQHACGLHPADPAHGEAVEALPDAPAAAVGAMPPQDWLALFDAVTGRLQQLAGTGPTVPNPGPGLRLPLQECIDDLRQLHRTLDARLQGGTHRLADLSVARAALAGARIALAYKLYDAVAAPLQPGARSLGVQPSIGIAIFPGDSACGATLLQRADAAMCSAKRHQQGYAFAEGCGAP